MNKKTDASSTNSVMEAASAIVVILESLDAEHRQRALATAVVALGGERIVVPRFDAPLEKRREEHDEGVARVSLRAQAWMRQHAISIDALQNVIAIEDGSTDVIAGDLPGTTNKQKTIEAYVLCGLRSLIQNNDATFSDDAARELCRHIGCFDRPNHAASLKDLGNLVTGTKGTGWRLTNPGLIEAARIVKAVQPAP